MSFDQKTIDEAQATSQDQELLVEECDSPSHLKDTIVSESVEILEHSCSDSKPPKAVQHGSHVEPDQS